MPARFKEWKTDAESGALVMISGNPVAVMDDGTEAPHDYLENHVRPLGKANTEAAERRGRISELEAKLEPWTAVGLDPAEVAKLQKELARRRKQVDGDNGNDPEQAAELTAKIGTLETQIEALTGERDGALGQVHSLTVGSEIKASKFFSASGGNQSLSLQHPDVAVRDLASYGESGSDGKVHWYTDAKDHSAAKMIRDQNGDPASTDNAIEQLGQQLGWWKSLLRGKGASGSGAAGGGGEVASGDIPKTGAQWRALSYDQRETVRAALKETHGEDGYRAALQRIIERKE